jgi:hypothetical protein
MVQCVGVDTSSSFRVLTVACVLCPSWTTMLLMVVQYKNIDDETRKERAYHESDSSLSRQATFYAP